LTHPPHPDVRADPQSAGKRTEFMTTLMSTACCEDADPATKAVEPIASDGSSQQTPCRPRRRRSPGVVGTAQNRRICMWSAMRAVASLGRTKSAFRSHVRFRSALRSVIIADPWKSCTTWPTAGWDLGNLFGSGRLDVGFSGPGVVGPRPRCRTAQPLGRPAPATACARLPPASGPPLLPGNNLVWHGRPALPGGFRSCGVAAVRYACPLITASPGTRVRTGRHPAGSMAAAVRARRMHDRPR
jgi:hypothetical protein